MGIRVGEFPLIEALVYMPGIDVSVLVLVCLDSSPIPIRFLSLVCVCEKVTSIGLCVRVYSKDLLLHIVGMGLGTCL